MISEISLILLLVALVGVIYYTLKLAVLKRHNTVFFTFLVFMTAAYIATAVFIGGTLAGLIGDGLKTEFIHPIRFVHF